MKVEPEVLTLLTQEAMRDIAHLLRPGHLQQLRNILDDPESSANDRFVALDLLKNAGIAAGGVLPMCQDTGTAIVKGKRGQYVFTGGGDEEAIARGIYETYRISHLRYSQLAPLTMWEEVDTGTNLPAEIKIAAVDGDTYKLLFMAKGGGSANKSYLFQETKAVLNEESLLGFLDAKIRSLGHRRLPAVPPRRRRRWYVGGAGRGDGQAGDHPLPGQRCPRPATSWAGGSGTTSWSSRCWSSPGGRASARSSAGSTSATTCAWSACRATERAARSPSPCRARRTARPSARSPPTACSWSNWRPTLPASYPRPRPTTWAARSSGSTSTGRWARSAPSCRGYPVKTRLSLSGPMIVARDIAHAKIKERLDAGLGLPQYLRDHAVYYAGPAKTPAGYASGSFGPTTAGRMDSYVDLLQANGGSFVMLAKGNRSQQVTDACARHGGFYLGSIGGPAARLAQDCIRSVEVLEYPELGMEAVWRIEVENFPAFIVVDDKGNDFFADTIQPVAIGR